ncbi:MAG: ferritin-like domain-containing protein, partial [Myxococcota bacterium]
MSDARADNVLDLGALALDRGGHLLVKRALARAGRVEVRGTDPHLAVHLRAFCRAAGHGFALEGGAIVIVRGSAASDRWASAERAGGVAASDPGAVVDHPPARWGLAARGALVEAGAPALAFALDDKAIVWSDEAPRLYAQAAAAQWDPETAIPWGASSDVPDEVEDAVVQVMTYLVENETAALLVPARFLARVHPHFREVLQVLAVQVADEARHIEVFTRRARL